MDVSGLPPFACEHSAVSRANELLVEEYVATSQARTVADEQFLDTIESGSVIKWLADARVVV
jgi:hypothetical protein